MVNKNDQRKRIAIIPARGGSKRIPRKNIIDFHGKPMIAWTIEAALNSDVFDRVIVSTDDPEIADISRKYGAEIPFLRTAYADDNSNVSQVILASLQRLNIDAGTVGMLMANCPLRQSKSIRRLTENFDRSGAEFQISAFNYGFANPWWAHRVDESGSAKPLFAEELTARSQDLPALLCPTGACWLARIPAFRSHETFYGPNYHFGLIDRVAAMDIDDEGDLRLARALFHTR